MKYMDLTGFCRMGVSRIKMILKGLTSPNKKKTEMGKKSETTLKKPSKMPASQ